MTFSLQLSDDVIEVRDWVHQFAAEVIRPAAAEWDEREETPWPVIQEAAKVGLYSPDLFAQQAGEPTGLGMLTVFEETVLGRRRYRTIHHGHRAGRSGVGGQRNPRTAGPLASRDVWHARRTPSSVHSAHRSPTRVLTSAPSAPVRATTRRPASGFSTAPRPGRPTAVSPTCTSWLHRSIPNSAPAARPHSSSRSGVKGFAQGQKFKKHGIRASHTAEVVLDDVRLPEDHILGGREKFEARIARVKSGTPRAGRQH